MKNLRLDCKEGDLQSQLLQRPLAVLGSSGLHISSSRSSRRRTVCTACWEAPRHTTEGTVPLGWCRGKSVLRKGISTCLYYFSTKHITPSDITVKSTQPMFHFLHLLTSFRVWFIDGVWNDTKVCSFSTGLCYQTQYRQ